MYVTCVTDSLLFLPLSKSFSASLAQIGFFSSQRFYFSVSHTDSPIMGASSQVSTVDLGQDLVHFKYFYLLKIEGIL